MDWRKLALCGAASLAWLNAEAVAGPREASVTREASVSREGSVTIVSNPVRCVELNASGTIVYNRCEEFVRFGWRNLTNCVDGCETEVSPAGFAVVAGLNGRYYYGACRDDQMLRWLGWKYSCYSRPR